MNLLNRFNTDSVIPIATSADGNCLYRALSTLVLGNEAMHKELRARTFLELKANELWFTEIQKSTELAVASGFMYDQSLVCCNEGAWADAWLCNA